MEFGERTQDCSPGHAGKEGPHLAMTGAYKVITDKYDPVAIYFIVLGSNLYTIFVMAAVTICSDFGAPKNKV